MLLDQPTPVHPAIIHGEPVLTRPTLAWRHYADQTRGWFAPYQCNTSGVLKLFSACTTNFFWLHLCTAFNFRKHHFDS